MNSSHEMVLAAMPGTLVAIRKKTGLARSTVARAVSVLHDANIPPKRGVPAAPACHIMHWIESAAGPNAPLLAVYRSGRGKDAPPVRIRGGRVVSCIAPAPVARDPFIWCMFDVNVQF